MGETKMNLHNFFQLIFDVVYRMALLVPDMHSSEFTYISPTPFTMVLRNKLLYQLQAS